MVGDARLGVEQQCEKKNSCLPEQTLSKVLQFYGNKTG